jgi:hypothetical protein
MYFAILSIGSAILTVALIGVLIAWFLFAKE